MFSIQTGNGKRKEDSGVLDQISDGDGRIVGSQVGILINVLFALNIVRSHLIFQRTIALS